jgi:hypothetical protein
MVWKQDGASIVLETGFACRDDLTFFAAPSLGQYVSRQAPPEAKDHGRRKFAAHLLSKPPRVDGFIVIFVNESVAASDDVRNGQPKR